MQILAYAILFLATFILAFVARGTTVGDLSAGAVVSLAIPLVTAITAGKIGLRLRWYSIRYRRQTIRISAAYLFRIKIDDKYLLVKGKRFPQYQPVGGVYKVTSDGRSFLAAIGATDDDLIPIDRDSSDDLRIRIPGARAAEFYAWFISRQGREDAPWREFYEELVKPGLVPAAKFPFIFHNYIRQDIDKIRFSRPANSLEILIADIYELVPDRAQESELRRLMRHHGDELSWATADSIKRLGATPGQPQTISIAEHSSRLV